MSSSIKGNFALVTGASSGLGVDFAKVLAEKGCNVILVARREDLLQKHQEEIKTKYNVQVEIIAMDLATKEAPENLYNLIKEKNINVDILINNAGFGIHDDFVNISWEQEEKMLNLNIITLVHLTKLFVKDMVAKNYGYILHVASIGAYQPVATYASYAASKSFVLNFGEAIRYELKDKNVKVTVLSPGATETEFFKVAGAEKNKYKDSVMMKSDIVAKLGIEGMLNNKATILPGVGNFLGAFASKIFPRNIITSITAKVMKDS